jgi:tetratricopeptide (TPR) repeat protein
MDVGQYRAAVFDMNDYEKAIGPNRLTPQFYYLRHRAELSARMYQQALDDIRRAVQLAPQEVAYHLEEAHLLLRVGLYEEAYVAAKAAQNLAPEDPVVLQLLEMIKREQ